MEHDTPGFARILKEYGSVSWDFRATTRLFSRSEHSMDICEFDVLSAKGLHTGQPGWLGAEISPRHSFLRKNVHVFI